MTDPTDDVPILAPGTYVVTKCVQVDQDGHARFIDMPDGADAEYVAGFWPKTRSWVRKVEGVPVGSTPDGGAQVSPVQTTGHAEASVSGGTDEPWHDAALAAWHAWGRFTTARGPLEFVDAITAMSNAMSDLGTFLPGYDYETGTIAEVDRG
jgi:hypothetical protein